MTGWRRARFRLAAFAAAVRDSYWFLPAVFAMVGLIAGVLLVSFDGRIGDGWVSGSNLFHASRPEGARAMLSTIAGSTITVAGVVFSVTLAAVTYAAGQHGPRLLTNFARDKGNQITLGVFIGTYNYCLVVLRTVRSAAETGRANDYFVPHTAVYAALGLALVSIAMLIYFVHHVTETIHINNVIGRIGASLISDICTKSVHGDVAKPKTMAPAVNAETTTLRTDATGYVQGIDQAALEALAESLDVEVDVQCRPGDFIRAGSPLFDIRGADAATIEAPDRWRETVTIGRRKTDLQDLRFGFDELNEIATRALSPGINDPFTAVACIDWLGAALSEYDRATARMHAGSQGSRVSVPALRYEDYLEASFGRLRQHASAEASVTAVILRTLASLAEASTIAAHRSALLAEHSKLARARKVEA